MVNDFRDFSEFPRRWERPCTALGRWSLWMLACVIILVVLFFTMMSLKGGLNEVTRLSAKAGGGFFSVPVLAWTLVAAFVSAVGAGIAAIAAIKRQGERSIVMVLPLLVCGMAILFAIGAMVE
jgi:hypothetical protein